MTREPTAQLRRQDLPSGPVPLHSPFYLARPALEAQAVAEIVQPSSLLRLKAPQKMGKSTLMLRLIQQAIALDYRPVYLDLQLAERAILAEPERFLRWFCLSASRCLKLEPQLEQWDTEIDSKLNCLLYLQNHLLRQTQRPIVVLLNEVNRIFDHPALAQSFLPLMRSLHEAGRYSQQLQSLRFVLAYSTEVYVPLELHQSPFNVGALIELPEFTLAEVQQLTEQYGLCWTLQQIADLHHLTGGHPYLVQLMLHWTAFAADPAAPFSQLEQVELAYSDHLQRLIQAVLAHPELALALRQILATDAAQPPIPAMALYRLQSLGLVKLQHNKPKVSCQLYQQYFSKYFLT